MQIFLKEEDFNLYVDGFGSEDILDRKPLAHQVSNLLMKSETPLVLAVDGAWGSGKSFFLKRWLGEHNAIFPSQSTLIYFDAFSHDFLDDPLIPLTQALLARGDLVSEDASKVRKIKEAAFKLSRPVMRIGLAAATSGLSEVVGPFFDGALSASTDEANKAIDEMWAREAGRQQAVETFKTALSAIIASKCEGDETENHKIIFVVDELDRCRPEFSLRLLEIIKHFFDIDNVHFLLGVSSKEFSGALESRYGEHVDAKKYLEKFVSLYVNLPDQRERNGLSVGAYELYLDKHAKSLGISNELTSELKIYLKYFPKVSPSSLRQFQKILAELSLISRARSDLDDREFGRRRMIVGLLLLKHADHEMLLKMLSGTADLAEVLNAFGLVVNPEAKYEEHVHLMLDMMFRTCLGPLEGKDVDAAMRGIWGPWGLDMDRDIISKYIRHSILGFSLPN